MGNNNFRADMKSTVTLYFGGGAVPVKIKTPTDLTDITNIINKGMYQGHAVSVNDDDRNKLIEIYNTSKNIKINTLRATSSDKLIVYFAGGDAAIKLDFPTNLQDIEDLINGKYKGSAASVTKKDKIELIKKYIELYPDNYFSENQMKIIVSWICGKDNPSKLKDIMHQAEITGKIDYRTPSETHYDEMPIIDYDGVKNTQPFYPKGILTDFIVGKQERV